MKNWSVNVPCLASFLMVVVVVHAASSKHQLTEKELNNREIMEWRLERMKTEQHQTLKSNLRERPGTRTIQQVLKVHDEAQTTDIPLIRTIFNVLDKPNPCPKDQKLDQAGNCREVFSPSSR